jgi:hypothetical protein
MLRHIAEAGSSHSLSSVTKHSAVFAVTLFMLLEAPGTLVPRHGVAIVVHGNNLQGGEKGVVIYGCSSMAEVMRPCYVRHAMTSES